VADYYLNNFRVSSAFGENRGSETHRGVDFAGLKPGEADGKNIPSLSAGTVEQVFVNNKTAGHGVVIRGADGNQYRYIHMKNAPKLKVGDKVGVGQSLGLIGSSGQSDGPHLDLKIVDKKGNYVDPIKVIKGMSASKAPAPKEGGSTYKNTWKTKNEALKAPGYQTYKKHLAQALQTGKIPANWVVALTELIGRESTWNSGVKNGKSSAWGYGQFINDTREDYEKKMGMSYDDPVNQIIMTAQYVKDRYGTPEKALLHWDKNNWY
jgi:hypothetical protein